MNELIDPLTEAALAGLRETAPKGLAHATLVAVGLADVTPLIDSPVGPLRWRGTAAACRRCRRRERPRVRGPVPRSNRPPRGTGRSAADRPRSTHPAPSRRRSTQPDPARPSWLDPVRAGGLDEGARDPAWRGPPVRLDRRGDRQAQAVRAVGTALGHNPVPLIVPCHRVVRSDGMIGQYSLGGPQNKRTILAEEGADPDALESLARRAFAISARTRPGSTASRPVATHDGSRRPPRPLRIGPRGEHGGIPTCSHCRPLGAAVA